MIACSTALLASQVKSSSKQLSLCPHHPLFSYHKFTLLKIYVVSKISKNILRPNFSQFMVTTFCLCFLLPYCPGQVPIGARSSSANIWGWVVTRGTCSTIPTQGPTLDGNLAPMGLHRRFVGYLSRPSRLWRKLHCATNWTDSQPRWNVSIAFSHRLQYANFVLQPQANKATDGCVWTFDAWCCGAQSASEQSQLSLLCELSGPSDSPRKNLAWWAITR